MAFDNTNTFILGKNKRKTKDTHPNLSGTLNIDGVEYWLSGWTKDKNGDRFITGTVKPKEVSVDKPKEPPVGGEFYSDDIPF